jgi:fermentation-respiration switch protein FrsA (DUF1100 family)
MGLPIGKLVFQPPESTYGRDEGLLWLHTSMQDLVPAFYLDRGHSLTILFSHGNAEDIGLVSQYFREASQIMQVNVFAYEYPGYGMSSGEPEEEKCYAAVEAAYKYMRDVLLIPWDSIVLYGRSLGSGPSCHLASRTAVRGVVLQSPVLSMYRVGLHLRFTLPGDLFANVDKIGDIVCPVYVVHGTRDEIVPVWHGQELHRLASDPWSPFWVEGGQHNDLEMVATAAFYERLQSFFAHLEKTPVSELLLKQHENSLL